MYIYAAIYMYSIQHRHKGTYRALHNDIRTLYSALLTYMAIGQRESLHADCAVLLWPLSPWQPECIVRPLAQIASLLYHIRALIWVDLGRAMALPDHDTHVITDTVPGGHQTLTLLILLCSQLHHAITCDSHMTIM